MALSAPEGLWPSLPGGSFVFVALCIYELTIIQRNRRSQDGFFSCLWNGTSTRYLNTRVSRTRLCPVVGPHPGNPFRGTRARFHSSHLARRSRPPSWHRAFS